MRISRTAEKGLQGARLVVRYTLSVLQQLVFLTRQAVVVLRAAARHTVRVTTLTVVGVFVTIETDRTRRNTSPICGRKNRRFLCCFLSRCCV